MNEWPRAHGSARGSPVMKLSLDAGDGTFCCGANRRGSATSHTLSALCDICPGAALRPVAGGFERRRDAAAIKLRSAAGMTASRSQIYATVGVSLGLIVTLILIQRSAVPVPVRVDPLELEPLPPTAPERMPNAWDVPDRGAADTVRQPRPEPDTVAPSFTPFTVAPQLQNEREVADSLTAHAGLGPRGAVAGVWVLISKEGRIRAARLHESSGSDAFDAAALRVARIMRFSPARNRGEVVSAWVSVPMRVDPQR